MHDRPTCSPQPWKHVSVFVLSILSINFFNIFCLTYDPLPFRHLSELEFQLLSDFAKVKVWATEKVRSGSSKKLIKTQYYSLFDPFQLHITLVWTGILLSVWLYKPKAENYWAVRERLEQVVRVQLYCISWDKRNCWEFWLRLALPRARP